MKWEEHYKNLIPKKVKVGDEIYDIKEVDYVGKSKINKVVLGRANFNRNTIRIKKGEKQDVKQGTLYHEIAHLIFYELSKENKKKKFRYIKIAQKLFYDEYFIEHLGRILKTTFNIK